MSANPVFRKVLVANRGEIAIRVMRTLRDLGIKSVAVYSDADARALHVRYADEAYHVGAAPSAQSYLRADRILEVARRSGAEAVHPGYGFLSENTDFAAQCEAAGIVFIGPPASAILDMGEKTRARRIMIASGVPVVPGTEHAIPDPMEALEIARKIGFPVLIKAAAGGGGKGMRRVDDEAMFLDSFSGAQREARSAFGDDACYLEKWIIRPKHVEIQVLADKHGNCVHLFERECSVQRRHQKVVEESPCPILRHDVRMAMGEVAVRAAKAVGYVGAGTCEFLIDHEQNFYFLEMNTRLQVEHPITEQVTGVDLVEQQVLIAAGQPLPFAQQDLSQHGHAIEIRVYAEDPENNFLPSPGPISHLHVPTGPGVRDDGGYETGTVVSMNYDPMISKFIVSAPTREKARARMLRCLDEYQVQGVETNLDFLKDCLKHPEFIDGSYDTGVVSGISAIRAAAAPPAEQDTEDALIAAAIWRHLSQAQMQQNGTGAEQGAADSPWLQFGRRKQIGRL